MINYAEKIFTKEYEERNKKFYACFHPEVIVDLEEYSATQRWLVVLLHPDNGLQTFFMLRNDSLNRWEVDVNSNVEIESDLLQWCGLQLEKKR